MSRLTTSSSMAPPSSSSARIVSFFRLPFHYYCGAGTSQKYPGPTPLTPSSSSTLSSSSWHWCFYLFIGAMVATTMAATSANPGSDGGALGDMTAFADVNNQSWSTTTAAAGPNDNVVVDNDLDNGTEKRHGKQVGLPSHRLRFRNRRHPHDDDDVSRFISSTEPDRKNEIPGVTTTAAAAASAAADDDDDGYDDDADGDDDDDTGRGGRMATNVCTAGYFFDRIIPEDYPHEISKDVKHINETIERLNRMYAFSNKMMERLSPFIREMVSRMTDYIYESQLDAECMGALFRVFRAINQRKPWAMSFLDASGSVFVGGFQQGMFVSLGEFDQCLEIESDPLDNNNLIYGQYCLLKPVVPLPEDGTIQQGEPIAQSRIPRVNKFLNDEYIDTYLGLYKFMKRTFLRVGLCLPHHCERQSLENAINRILVRKTGMSVQVGPECVKATDSVPLSPVQIVTLVTFGLMLILVILSTGYEIIYRHMFENRHSLTFATAEHRSSSDSAAAAAAAKLYLQDKPALVQCLTSFSIIRNTRHLFDHPLPSRYPQLDTMRLLLTLFFFITNAYYYTLVFAPMIIKRFYVQGPMQFLSEKKYFFIRMYYLIDCFVVFSGIALTLSFHRRTFSYLPYVVRMYIRYTLPILVSIGLIFVVPLFGSGPLWHLFDQTMTQPCRENFWSTLLFYNNFHTNIEEILKLFAPMILMVNSQLAPKTGTMFLLLLLLVSFVGNLFYRFYYDYKIPYEFWMMKSFSEMKQSVMFYFFNPFCHLSPLLIGLLVGHLIMTGPRIPGSTVRAGINGVLCTAAFLASFLWIENLDLLKPQIGTVQLVTMLTVGRAMLVAMHAWIIYASIKGHITIVNRFLSSIAFRPLSQLSYGFYLTSIIVTCYRLFSIRQTIILSGQTMFRAIVSDAVISFLFSYLIHIMVQQPVRNLLHIRALWRCVATDESEADDDDDDDNAKPKPAVYFVRTYSNEQKFKSKMADANNNRPPDAEQDKSVMLHIVNDHNHHPQNKSAIS